MLQLEKTHLDLNEESFIELEKAEIGVSPGKIARLLLSIVNKRVEGFYQELKLFHTQTAVSLAGERDRSLELIGELLDCHRNPGEDIEDYRYRITKQPLTLARANEMAVRLACLSVEGVEDVVMKPFTHGTGSFSVYVVTDSPETPEEILQNVQTKLDEFKAYGIYAKSFTPLLLPVEMRIRLLFDKKVLDSEKQSLRNQAQQIIKNYINSIPVGGTLTPAEIRNQILLSSTGIVTVNIYHFRINERSQLLFSQDAGWNERFIQASVPNAILVS